MDTLAHGLWGGAAFGQSSKRVWRWAFFLGMCPDLFSFGPYFLTHFPTIIDRWRHHAFGPPAAHMIPHYVYQAYNVTHSLVIWTLLLGLAVGLYGRDGWVIMAWALHILFDIPTHSLRFFPTPYLWPFHTPFVDGRPWARPTFMIANYSAIALAYLLLLAVKRLRKS